MPASPASAFFDLPNLPRYLAGRFVSALGRQMLGLAIGWQLYERTGSAFSLGLVGLVQVVPVVVLALPAGHIVDRHNRRDLLIASQLLLAICGLGFAAISHFHAPVAAVYALLFLFGIGVAFNSPSSAALLPQLVPRDHLVTANAWFSTAFQLAAMSGPALGGLLIRLTGGATIVYLAEAVASFAFVGILLFIDRPPTPPPSPRSPDELRAGLRFVFKNELLLSAITLDLFAVLLGGATALLPIFARDILFVGPIGLGVLQASPAIGAALMAVITTRLSPWKRTGRALLISVAGFGLATLGFGLSRNFWLSLAMLILTGAFDNVSVVIRISLEQLLTPDRLRGRVSAVHYVFIGLSNELGEFESGVTAALLGPIGAVLLGGAGTLAVVSLVILRWPSLLRLGAIRDIPRPEEGAA